MNQGKHSARRVCAPYQAAPGDHCAPGTYSMASLGLRFYDGHPGKVLFDKPTGRAVTSIGELFKDG